jgi:glycosyltransferase involved in cell wall biosynthesis
LSGGINVYTQELVQALADHSQRYDYAVLVSGSTETWQFRTWPRHIRFISLDHRPWLDHLCHISWFIKRILGDRMMDLNTYLDVKSLSSILHHEGIQVLHYPRTAIPPRHQLLQVPMVLTFFDMQQEYMPEFFTEGELEERKNIFRPSTERADYIITPSSFTADSLREKFETPEDKMISIPVGVPNNCRRISPDAVALVRGKYHLPDHYIIYPANPWLHKNHARLMVALRLLKDRRSLKVNLVLTGKLQNTAWSAMPLALAAGIEDQVRDLGYVPLEDMPALYSGADMLIFPSLFEGFGIPLLEAMACGVPVVAARSTSIPDVTGDAALLFDPLSPADMAEAIYRVMSDSVLAGDLARRGLERAGRFAWPVLVGALEEVYAKAALVVRKEH